MLKIKQIYRERLVARKADTSKKRFRDMVCLIIEANKETFYLLPLDSLEKEGPFGLYGNKNEKSFRYQLRPCERGEAKNLLDYKERKLQLEIDGAREAKKSQMEIREAKKELQEFVDLRAKIERRRKI